MKFTIEISYEDTADNDGKPNYELNVTSDFTDEAAVIVAKTLETFQKVFAETKNNTHYIKN